MAVKEHVEIPHPVYEERVDMSGVQHVLHSPPVQRMAQIKQLGGAYFIFPFATHTRLAHMIGVTYIAQLRGTWLTARTEISGRESRTLAVCALVHDVGHWAFSHLLEPLCGNHDVRGLELVRGELAPYIRKEDVNPEDVAEMMERKNTLSELIFTNPIGADKLDYLTIDAFTSIGKGSSLKDLFTSHVRWDRRSGLYILPKGLELLVQTIQRSWYMFTEVYERPSTRVFQRYLQEMLRQMVEIDPIVKSRLYNGGEDGVIGAIGYWAEQNPTHECAERHLQFQRRNHPKKALVFCEEPELAPLRNKPTMAKITCDKQLIEASAGWNLDQVAAVEGKIAQLLGITHPQVTVAVSPPPRRWNVPAVKVESCDGVRMIGDLMPQLHVDAKVQAMIACNIVIAVDADVRPRLVADVGLHHAVAEILAEA